MTYGTDYYTTYITGSKSGQKSNGEGNSSNGNQDVADIVFYYIKRIFENLI